MADSQEAHGRAGIWWTWITPSRSPRTSWPRAPWSSPLGPGTALPGRDRGTTGVGGCTVHRPAEGGGRSWPVWKTGPPAWLRPPTPGRDPAQQRIEFPVPADRLYAVARGHHLIFLRLCSPTGSSTVAGLVYSPKPHAQNSQLTIDGWSTRLFRNAWRADTGPARLE